MKFSNFLFPQSSDPQDDGRVIDETLHEARLSDELGVERCTAVAHCSSVAVAARARGVPEWRLVLKYPVRIALNPFISTLGYLFPFLLSGSVIVSVVLSLPTLGPTLLIALTSQDLMLGATIVLMLGVLTVIGTLISDILLVVFDPRIKIED